MIKCIFSSLMVILLCSCGMSARHLSTHGLPPSSIKVVNISIDEELTIDQKSYAIDRNKSAVAMLPDGWHVVRIMMRGVLVSERRVFLQDGIQKVIDARAE